MIDFISIEEFFSSCIRNGKRFWHLWTPENHQILFSSDDDFRTGMNLIAVCAAMYPEIQILTFELMSNHLHFTLIGSEADILSFFNTIKKYIGRWLQHNKRYVDLSGFNCNLRELMSWAEIRDVISYNNRNGFLVNPDYTPFSYPWGANRFFFNPDAKARFSNEAVKMTVSHRRELIHSKAADKLDSIMMLDGYACPLCFCRIETAEKFYRNASNYLYGISRNIESAKKIAQECGERVFYSDDELFRITCSLADSKSKNTPPGLLPKEGKIEIARILHYDYNAGNKSIARLLKLDITIVNGMFPPGNTV